jgi:hypothetical protein
MPTLLSWELRQIAHMNPEEIRLQPRSEQNMLRSPGPGQRSTNLEAATRGDSEGALEEVQVFTARN